VQRFVIKQNIEHYRAMLKITTDLERRAVFEKLLREEEAKLRKYNDDHKKK
jgi:rubrerythrin